MITGELAKRIAYKLVNVPIQYPNPVLNVGVFEGENNASMPQVPILVGLSKPQINEDVDTSYLKETGKGSLHVPNTKDFYTGEAL